MYVTLFMLRAKKTNLLKLNNRCVEEDKENKKQSNSEEQNNTYTDSIRIYHKFSVCIKIRKVGIQ